MSELPPSLPPVPSSTDDLQFNVAEPAAGVSTPYQTPRQPCLACGRPIDSVYYSLNGKPLCEQCHAQFVAGPQDGAFLRVAKATLLGFGAGLVGALVWFLVRRFANIQIGLIAVLVGYMVGKTVRKCSMGRGGRGYQFLAIAITYCCIAANYLPDLLESYLGNSKENIPIQYVSFAFKRALELPVLLGIRSPIGLVIVGFALWEAWKFNARVPITGPYRIGGVRPMMPS